MCRVRQRWRDERACTKSNSLDKLSPVYDVLGDFLDRINEVECVTMTIARCGIALVKFDAVDLIPECDLLRLLRYVFYPCTVASHVKNEPTDEEEKEERETRRTEDCSNWVLSQQDDRLRPDTGSHSQASSEPWTRFRRHSAYRIAY